MLKCVAGLKVVSGASRAGASNTHRFFHSSSLLKVVHRADHYSILGVPHTATAKEIKAAFYKRSMESHPDRNQGSDEAHKTFLRINEAYSVLGNEKSRYSYDRTMRIRSTSSYQSRSAPHRYHNTAFTSRGEYSSARRTEPKFTHRHSSYGRYAANGQRVKYDFAEWERQHYQKNKDAAAHIHHSAQKTANSGRTSTAQVALHQLLEMGVAFAAAFGIGWVGSKAIRANGGYAR